MSSNPPPVPQSSGLAPNVAGALAYLLGPITGILFLVIEKENRFVRFHAAQSIGLSVSWIALWIVLTIVSTVLGAIPGIGWIMAIIFFLVSIGIGLGGLVLWLFLMFQAFSNKEWELPVIGEQSRRLISGAQTSH